MKPESPVTTFTPETAADAWMGLLAMRGVDYLFANGGTDFAPVVEAFAKGEKLGWRLPEIVIVPHENMGIAMAHGYAMVTGRPQAMMVHVGVGTANTINGLINASRTNIPILLTAGRTPITEGHGAASGGGGALVGARNNYIHWAQEHFDQGGMLREFVKWDYELRHPEQVETVLDRALAICKSEPQGPVYVTLPREVLAQGFSQRFSQDTTIQAASAPAADADALEEAAKLLGGAQKPLLITANGGRTLESARARRAGGALPPALSRSLHRAPDAMRLGSAPAAQGSRRRAGGGLRRALDSARGQSQARCEGHPHRPGPALCTLSAARLPHRPRAHRRRRGDAAGAVAQRAEARGFPADDRRAAPERNEAISGNKKERARRLRPHAVDHHGEVALGLREPPARQQHGPRQRVSDGAGGNADPRARPLLRQPFRGRPGLGHGRGARREARIAGQERDLRGRRRRLHVRQPDRRALRVGSDEAADPLHHREQRPLGGGAPLDAVDLPEGIRRGKRTPALRHARALASLRARRQGEGRPRRPRQRAEGAHAGARAREEDSARRKAPGACQRLHGSELRQDQLVGARPMGGLRRGSGVRRRLELDHRNERRADAPDQRKLQPARAEADVEPQDVELEALNPARGDAKETSEGNLVAAAARRRAEHGAPEVILADGSRRQVDAQLGHGARDPCREGVRVRSRPDGVFIRVGIVARRLVDAPDELVHPLDRK